VVAIAAATAVYVWNALTSPLMRGYDDFGHVGYIFFIDLYRALPWADQGWSYFHPPLHYLFGWVLVQLRSTEVLLRGLALLNGAWSLGVAALAAAVVRRSTPGRPGLSLLAFTSVAFLPVFLYTSGMAGNELTATFFWTLGLGCLLVNECRERPALAWDAMAGAAIGLGLLAKFTAALALAAAVTTLLLRGLRSGSDTAVWRRVTARGLLLCTVALALAGPYYARNVREFGTPFQMSRDTSYVSTVESQQPPGFRTWVDFVYVPGRLLLDPDPKSEHLLHSVWGSAYAQMWADPRGARLFPVRQERKHAWIRSYRIVVPLGLAPTLLALAGGFLAVRDTVRGRRVEVYAPLFAMAGFTLAAFAWFAIDAPQFSALKASYLFGLTLPYAAFLARAIEALDGWRSPLPGRAAAGLVVVAAGAAGVANASGLALPRPVDHTHTALVRFHLERDDEVRQWFQRHLRNPLVAAGPWIDNLAALEMLEGDPAAALELLLGADLEEGDSPFRRNAAGVAAALDGRHREALSLFDEAIDAGAGAVSLVNRGALRALRGELAAAESDLRAALALEPDLAPAWHDLAEVLALAQRPEEAAAARESATRAAQTPPRGYPYGIPSGLAQYPLPTLGLRSMLWLEGGVLKLARAPFRPEDAIDVAARVAPPDGPNLVLIAIDSLRADHLGSYGYGRPTSPHIDTLARSGTRFEHAYAPSSWTLPSVASLFTSQLPSEHGARAWMNPVALGMPALAGILRRAGYRTIGVSGNFVHVSRATGLARGFEVWERLLFHLDVGEDDPLLVLDRRDGGRVGVRAPSAEEVNAAVLAHLPAAGERPLFLFVHYMEPHSGYAPREPHRSAFARDSAAHARGEPATSEYVTALSRGERTADAGERQRLVDLYDAEIAVVDEAIGALLDALRQRGYTDDLVVTVVADHGEEFADHRGYFHGVTLHRESLRVPLVIRDFRDPGPGVVRSDPVDLLDVPTTLLALAGVPAPPPMRGRDLFDAEAVGHRDLVAQLDPDPIFEKNVAPRRQRQAFLRWPWKVIVDADGRAEFYRVDRDPAEVSPMGAGNPQVPDPLRRVALRLAREASTARAAAPTPTEPLDPRTREELRALGYAE
jgi:arylsulfatase